MTTKQNEMEKRRKSGLPIIINREGNIINITPHQKWEEANEKENIKH